MIKPGIDTIAGVETAWIPFASWLADALDPPRRPFGVAPPHRQRPFRVRPLRIAEARGSLEQFGSGDLVQSLNLFGDRGTDGFLRIIDDIEQPLIGLFADVDRQRLFVKGGDVALYHVREQAIKRPVIRVGRGQLENFVME